LPQGLLDLLRRSSLGVLMLRVPVLVSLLLLQQQLLLLMILLMILLLLSGS